ncbi:Retrovirus-related Pol polyprotein from type-1 retrotransposable element R1 4 [Eumeta japonica]|uniref:Retrovirus-related Pol polyprotein from type-1 retrotransposable element R1 4 n=1 Tax=Eumeta variegata TaxID=151549 RepID=A0A4C1XPB1_EUMVA|nr:Retrovirus-related Pol polyprotein from type-1 retrotransposable element R1 4 [Eumeta japonica]
MKRLVDVGEAREICKDRTVWKSIVSDYPFWEIGDIVYTAFESGRSAIEYINVARANAGPQRILKRPKHAKRVQGEGYMEDALIPPNQTLSIFAEWLKTCVVMNLWWAWTSNAFTLAQCGLAAVKDRSHQRYDNVRDRRLNVFSEEQSAYRTTSTEALPVLAGVLPVEVTLVGRVDSEHDNHTRVGVGALRRRVPLSFDWVESDYETSQLFTRHGCFMKRLHELALNETSVCLCGLTEEDMHHLLWACPLYDDIRAEMLGCLDVLQVDPVYCADLVGSRKNFCRFREFTLAWHRLSGGLK